MIFNLAKILMEARDQTVTIKSLSFFLGLIVFGVSLVLSLNGIIKSAVDKGVSDAIEKVGLKIEINKAEQKAIDAKQDNKIDNLDTRLVHIENLRK